MIVEPELARRQFELDIKPLFDNEDIFQGCGIRLVKYAWPHLTVGLRWNDADAILRIEAADYDLVPISGRWIDADGVLLLAGRKLVPSGNGFHPQGQAGPGTPGLLCFAGWREYYELHPQDSWPALRGQAHYKPLALLQHIASLLARGVEAA